jgi:hypothetical protein
MIRNAYGVLDGLVSPSRLGLGLLVLWPGAPTWRSWGRAPGPEGKKAVEGRCYLLFLLAGLLLALNVAAWPLFYLLLLAALGRPTRGQVLFGGKDLRGCSDMEPARARRRFGFIFQDFTPIPNLSAADNVTYPLIRASMSPPAPRRWPPAFMSWRHATADAHTPGALASAARDPAGGGQSSRRRRTARKWEGAADGFPRPSVDG